MRNNILCLILQLCFIVRKPVVTAVITLTHGRGAGVAYMLEAGHIGFIHGTDHQNCFWDADLNSGIVKWAGKNVHAYQIICFANDFASVALSRTTGI